MTAAASSVLNPVNGDFEAVDGELRSDMLARRLKRRRQMLALAAASHAVNVVLLFVFLAAGTIDGTIVAAYAGCAFASVLIFLAISESGLTDDWRDHFFAAPYTEIGRAHV